MKGLQEASKASKVTPPRLISDFTILYLAFERNKKHGDRGVGEGGEL